MVPACFLLLSPRQVYIAADDDTFARLPALLSLSSSVHEQMVRIWSPIGRKLFVGDRQNMLFDFDAWVVGLKVLGDLRVLAYVAAIDAQLRALQGGVVLTTSMRRWYSHQATEA